MNGGFLEAGRRARDSDYDNERKKAPLVFATRVLMMMYLVTSGRGVNCCRSTCRIILLTTAFMDTVCQSKRITCVITTFIFVILHITYPPLSHNPSKHGPLEPQKAKK